MTTETSHYKNAKLQGTALKMVSQLKGRGSPTSVSQDLKGYNEADERGTHSVSAIRKKDVQATTKKKSSEYIKLDKPPRTVQKHQAILYKWDSPYGWHLGIVYKKYSGPKKYTHWVKYEDGIYSHRLTSDGYGKLWIALKRK